MSEAGNKRNEIILNVFLVSATLVLIALIASKHITIGDRWTFPYPYTRKIGIYPFLIACGLVPLLLLLVFLTEKYLDRYAGRLMAIWFVAGTFSQVILSSLYIYPLAKIVDRDLGASYSLFTRQYSLIDLLRHYDSLSATYPLMTIRNNMPGKGILVKLLDLLTGSPYIKGMMLILISNLGAVLVYFICKRLFGKQRTAMYAFILYLYLPAKMFFFSQLNVITPVFILTCFLLLLIYLDNGKAVYACLLGVSIFMTMYFEATPLVLGLVFLAFIYRNLREKKTGMRSLLKGLLFTTGAFLALFLLFLVAFDYNIVTGMVAKYTHNWDYIAAPQFGYLRSLVLNLKEFFISMGMPQSIMFFVFCGSLIAGLISVSRKKREGGKGVLAYLMQPGPLLLVSCFFTLLVIDLLGVNRAEITRVWIYMMVFMDMCIAFFMGERESRVTFYTLLACKVFQTAVTIYMVGFVL